MSSELEDKKTSAKDHVAPEEGGSTSAPAAEQVIPPPSTLKEDPSSTLAIEKCTTTPSTEPLAKETQSTPCESKNNDENNKNSEKEKEPAAAPVASRVSDKNEDEDIRGEERPVAKGNKTHEQDVEKKAVTTDFEDSRREERKHFKKKMMMSMDDIVAQTPSATREWHKELLLGMMLKLDSRCLQSVTNVASFSGMMVSGESHVVGRRGGAGCDRPHGPGKEQEQRGSQPTILTPENVSSFGTSIAVTDHPRKDEDLTLLAGVSKGKSGSLSTSANKETVTMLPGVDRQQDKASDASGRNVGDAKPRTGPSPLSLIPHALKGDSQQEEQFEQEGAVEVVGAPFGAAGAVVEHDVSTSRTGGISVMVTAPPTKPVVSNTIEQVEAFVADRFAVSLIGRNAISTMNRSFENCHVAAAARTEQPTKSEMKPLGLVYNECSMAALGKWSRNCAAVDVIKSPEHSFSAPAASKSFRFCSICNKFGHYEVECTLLPRSAALTLEVGHELSVQNTLRHFVEQYGYVEDEERALAAAASLDPSQFATCEVCGSSYSDEALLMCDGCDRLYHAVCLDPPLSRIPDGDWFCRDCLEYNSAVDNSVVVESIEGFVVEQRKGPSDEDDEDVPAWDPYGIDVPEEAWCTAVGVAKASLIPDNISVASPSDGKGEYNITLADGELCWAKREHASDGKMAKHEWWPSSVITTVKELKSRKQKHREMTLTPYLVRMFGLHGASRTRASAVLPFFPHFEELGYIRPKRFGKQKLENPATFESILARAISEAIKQLGFSTPAQALKNARDITHNQRRLVRKVPPNWEHADHTVVNGFLVLAKAEGNERKSPGANVGRPRKRKAPNTPTPVAKRPKDEDSADPSTQTLLDGLRLAGSIVAWHLNDTVNVGVVHEIDKHHRRALVQPIKEWEKIFLPSELEKNEADPHHLVDLFKVSVSTVGASVWVPAEALEIVCTGPKGSWQRLFQNEIMPERLLATRQKRAEQLVNKSEAKTKSPADAESSTPTQDQEGDPSQETRPASSTRIDSKAAPLDSPGPDFETDPGDPVKVLQSEARKPSGDIKGDEEEETSIARNDNESSSNQPTSVTELKPAPEPPAPGPLDSKQPANDSPVPLMVGSLPPVAASLAPASSPQPRTESKDADSVASKHDSDSDFDQATSKSTDESDEDVEDGGHVSSESEPVLKKARRSTRVPKLPTRQNSISSISSDVKTPPRSAKARARAAVTSTAGLESDEKSSDDQMSAGAMEAEMQDHGLFQIEEILDERRIHNSTGFQYKIKWRGFPMEDCTWEPQYNILNKNFVRKFRVERSLKAVKKLSDGKEEVDPVVAKVRRALERGVDALTPIPPNKTAGEERPRFECPFCLLQMGSNVALTGHLKARHKTAPFYAQIREAAPHIDIKWYKEGETDEQTEDSKPPAMASK